VKSILVSLLLSSVVLSKAVLSYFDSRLFGSAVVWSP
jgi:hypothetical protein